MSAEAFRVMMVAEEMRILSRGIAMTKLEEVLAESWKSAGAEVNTGDMFGSPIGFFRNPMVKLHERDAWDDARDADRAMVAVLGKRALALILEYEWGGGDCGGFCIGECGAYVNDGHDPSCEIGKLVAEAKAIG